MTKNQMLLAGDTSLICQHDTLADLLKHYKIGEQVDSLIVSMDQPGIEDLVNLAKRSGIPVIGFQAEPYNFDRFPQVIKLDGEGRQYNSYATYILEMDLVNASDCVVIIGAIDNKLYDSLICRVESTTKTLYLRGSDTQVDIQYRHPIEVKSGIVLYDGN